ncbi:MAG TPA: hypothetical protein VFQ21_05665, partial [Gemmatimonadota bacterium]|nr:hypothetical protein [Gemmatimonadota bacterium]
RSYGRWLMFMPSILFWPASIGKESWLLFALGIAAFGAAKVLTERAIPGLVVSAVGIGLAALVRAPIAVVLGAGLVVAGILRAPRRRLGDLNPGARLVSLAFFAVLALGLASLLQGYVVRNADRDSQGRAGLGDIVQQSIEQTSQGGTEFTPIGIDSPAGLVIAPVTVMFRPFIHEVPFSPEGVVTSIESMLLLVWSIWRLRSFLSAFRNIRRVPYVAVAGVYVAGSIIALSVVANFGIIVRQRTLILPMYLVLMCFLPKRPRDRRTPQRVPVALTAEGRS